MGYYWSEINHNQTQRIMSEVKATRTMDIPANKVWRKVSQFSGIEDFTFIEKSEVDGEGVGTNRICYMPDGAELKEKLVTLDNDAMKLQYQITESPFPIDNYTGTILVKKVDDSSSEVSWSSSFDAVGAPAEALEKDFEGFLNGFLEGLEDYLSN